jgi:phosphatidylserine decarboxylase
MAVSAWHETMIAPRCRNIALMPLPIVLVFVVLLWIDARMFILLPISIIIQGFFLFFFRDPQRLIGEGITSPADGVVVKASHGYISIFMNIWNVHVNRAPIAGIIVSMQHIPGRHTPAYKNVECNERLVTTINTDYGVLKIVQIAGIFARRIVPYVNIGTTVAKGQRLGIVRFGSRVDVQVPSNIVWTVKKGDLVHAGQSIGRVNEASIID